MCTDIQQNLLILLWIDCTEDQSWTASAVIITELPASQLKRQVFEKQHTHNSSSHKTFQGMQSKPCNKKINILHAAVYSHLTTWKNSGHMIFPSTTIGRLNLKINIQKQRGTIITFISFFFYIQNENISNTTEDRTHRSFEAGRLSITLFVSPWKCLGPGPLPCHSQMVMQWHFSKG